MFDCLTTNRNRTSEQKETERTEGIFLCFLGCLLFNLQFAMSEEKPKIIIDEDWKSQVEAEKQSADAPSAAAPPANADDPPMPPASFELLLSSLATEAMLALGQLPHPLTGKPEVRRNQAKYLIDMIEVLKDKTKGNLRPGDEQAIEDLLHQLRLAFVATAP